MSQPKTSLAKTKCRLGTRVWVHNLSSSGWTGPKEDWKCNLMCQQKDILHLDTFKEVPHWAVALLETPSYCPGASIFSRQGSPLPWGSRLRTQGWAESWQCEEKGPRLRLQKEQENEKIRPRKGKAER